MEKFTSGAIPAKSSYDLLNEKRQSVAKGMGLKRFSYSFKKSSRVLFSVQMAIPFNPATGEADDDFNPNQKWRPALSASTAASIVKQYCSDNPKAREVFEKRAGVATWDVSQPEVLTSADLDVLRDYRTPLILTTECTSIKDPAVTGQDFAIQYSVDVKRDVNTGLFTGKVPEVAKIGALMSSVAFKEVEELREAIKAKDPTKYRGGNPGISVASIPAVTDKDATHKKWVSEIFQTVKISSVRPTNFLLGFELALDPSDARMISQDKQPMPDFTMLGLDDIKSKMVYFNYSDKYKQFIENVLSTPSLDNHFDFVECDFIDQTLVDPGADQTAKMLAAKNLVPSKAVHSFIDVDRSELRFPWIGEFIDAVAAYRDSETDFESKMLQFLATKVRAIDDSITAAVCDRIKEHTPINHMYYTDDILRTHKDALITIYGDEYTMLLMEKGLLDSAPAEEKALEEANKQEQVSVNSLLDEFSSDSAEADIVVDETPVTTTEVSI